MRIDRFYHKDCGWHFHVYRRNARPFEFSLFGIWWTKRCDCGVSIGRRAWGCVF